LLVKELTNVYHQFQGVTLKFIKYYLHSATRLTPFLPGMPHSQFIKFNVPSTAFVGRATNPCTQNRTTDRMLQIS